MAAGKPHAAPQQSSLKDAWSKKSKPAKAKKDDNKMEVDQPDDKSGAPVASREPHENLSDASLYIGSTTTSKGKEKAVKPPQDDNSDDATTRAVNTKKRRIMDSDDEMGERKATNATNSSEKQTKKQRSTRPKSSAVKTSRSKPPKSSKTSSPAPEDADEDMNTKASEASDEAVPEPDEADEGESELEDEEDESSSKAAKLASKHSLPNVELKGVVWNDGDPVPYAALAHVFSLIEATTKRLEITSLLTAFFILVIQRRKHGDSDSLRQAVYLCINRASRSSAIPSIELGIGESLLVKAIAESTEAVAVDKTTGTLLPFQELSKRKRKDVKVEDIQVKVCLFGFDLLYLNGEPLLHRPLSERRQLLRGAFVPVQGEFSFANASDSNVVDDIQAFLDVSVKDGCEGLMVKMLDSTESHYEPSRRSVNWLKLKKDYLSGVGDSLDLVVVGAYYGKGKRTNVYGAYLLACYDSDSEQYQTICKIGTGFSDEVLAEHFAQLKPLETGDKPRGDVNAGGAKPDVWLKPQVVWEVLAADLSLSPVYTAAQGLVDQRGISLRFPRFIRARDDKSPEDATGPEQVSEMYERQSLTQGKGGKKGVDAGDDFW
ncbi:hypothetical protein FRB99_006198 [Tulasnella sp. 403]|nr:hypothetical protein FRB99_006198 [Tulasnella sp. 403]